YLQSSRQPSRISVLPGLDPPGNLMSRTRALADSRSQWRGCGFADAVFEVDVGGESGVRPGAVAGGVDVADVAGSPRPRDDRVGRVGSKGTGERVCQVEDGARAAGGDVERPSHRARRGEGEEIGARDVSDVDEVAQLATVLEHVGGIAAFEGAAKDAGDAGIGRVVRHARPVDVVVAE